MRPNPRPLWSVSILRGTALVSAMLLFVTSAGHSDEARGTLQMRANVRLRTDVAVLAPQQLVVAPITRGQRTGVASHALTLRALSNSPRGLQVLLVAPPGMFAEMHVSGPDIDAHLPGEGGTIAWRWHTKPGFGTPASLPLRLVLQPSDTLPAGNYAWPIVVNTAPLPP